MSDYNSYRTWIQNEDGTYILSKYVVWDLEFPTFFLSEIFDFSQS